MSAPPFVFNHRTGELTRDGRMVALCRLHAEMFACLAAAQTPIGAGAIAKAINMPKHSVENEMPALIRRLKPLGINVAMARGQPHGGGRWLEFEEIEKWKPTIPEPVRLEGEVP